MFDADTVDLIRKASPLEGLDLETLPDTLTQAYALVVAARLGAVEPASEHWSSSVGQLRRLAETYEALTIFLPSGSPHREACAFVAGSAHFTLNQLRRVRAREGELSLEPSLTTSSVAPELAACLLFLIGEHQADAAEAAKEFRRQASPRIEHVLRGIGALAAGDGEALSGYASTPVPHVARDTHDYLELAAESLWARLATAIRNLCLVSLGSEAEAPEVQIDAVLRLLETSQTTIEVGEQRYALSLALAGPYHLARLLRPAAHALLTARVVALPTPPAVDDREWRAFLARYAARRPFLWQNHRSALARGLLTGGRSFALTFPTGAGKTTLSELRVGTEILRGRGVVFLAPTRALVDQISADLSAALQPLGSEVVRDRFLEDFGEQPEAKVFVQTPEQCLAYLAHDRVHHTEIGLVVVDEFHTLSGTVNRGQYGLAEMPSSRAVDAVWSLLVLLE